MLAGNRIADHAPDQQLVNPNLHSSLANQCSGVQPALTGLD
jgi:hypothetical protein